MKKKKLTFAVESQDEVRVILSTVYQHTTTKMLLPGLQSVHLTKPTQQFYDRRSFPKLRKLPERNVRLVALRIISCRLFSL